MRALLSAYRDAIQQCELTRTEARFDVADELAARGCGDLVPESWEYSPGLSARNGSGPEEPFWSFFMDSPPSSAVLSDFAASRWLTPAPEVIR